MSRTVALRQGNSPVPFSRNAGWRNGVDLNVVWTSTPGKSRTRFPRMSSPQPNIYTHWSVTITHTATAISIWNFKFTRRWLSSLLTYGRQVGRDKCVDYSLHHQDIINERDKRFGYVILEFRYIYTKPYALHQSPYTNKSDVFDISQSPCPASTTRSRNYDGDVTTPHRTSTSHNQSVARQLARHSVIWWESGKLPTLSSDSLSS